jgi:hypothetical protein
VILQLATISNDHPSAGLAAAAPERFHLLDQGHALHNFAKNNLGAQSVMRALTMTLKRAAHVLAVQPAAWGCSEKELAAVGVRSSVGHGQQPWHVVFVLEVLVGEFAAVDAFPCGWASTKRKREGVLNQRQRTASAVVVGKIATLTHELRYNAMKRTESGNESRFNEAEEE